MGRVRFSAYMAFWALIFSALTYLAWVEPDSILRMNRRQQRWYLIRLPNELADKVALFTGRFLCPVLTLVSLLLAIFGFPELP